MREVWGIRGGWSGRQSSQPASHCFDRLCSGFDTGHSSFNLNFRGQKCTRKGKFWNSRSNTGSPDRETLRASHANAASYFLVLEEQLKEVGLQKCHRSPSLSKGEEERGNERKGPGPGNWMLFWSDLKPLERWQPEYTLLREGWDCRQVDRKLCWMLRVGRLIIQDLNIMRLAILWRKGFQCFDAPQEASQRGDKCADSGSLGARRSAEPYYAENTSSSTIQDAPLFFLFQVPHSKRQSVLVH